MKIAPIVLLFLLLLSCSSERNKIPKSKTSIPEQIVKPEIQALLDGAEVTGSILIYDKNNDTYYSNDFKWASEGNLPASTYKIPNTIIGLETGVIENDSTVFLWDGEERNMDRWEQDLVLKKAFQLSCVPCYQEVARKIGTAIMNGYVQKLQYGNMHIDSSNIDNFWLLGKSRISQMQQIDFLMKLYYRELPISERTMKIVKKIMITERSEEYTLSGKTGLSIEDGNYNGWYVGYVESNNNVLFFATNMEPNVDSDIDHFIKKRIDLTLSAIKELNMID